MRSFRWPLMMSERRSKVTLPARDKVTQKSTNIVSRSRREEERFIFCFAGVVSELKGKLCVKPMYHPSRLFLQKKKKKRTQEEGTQHVCTYDKLFNQAAGEARTTNTACVYLLPSHTVQPLTFCNCNKY
jgi:hypothetical protein